MMDAILTDAHLGTRIKRWILMNVITPKLDYAGEVLGREREVRVKLETVHMTTTNKY